jgi:hypothetical protein
MTMGWKGQVLRRARANGGGVRHYGGHRAQKTGSCSNVPDLREQLRTLSGSDSPGVSWLLAASGSFLVRSVAATRR